MASLDVDATARRLAEEYVKSKRHKYQSGIGIANDHMWRRVHEQLTDFNLGVGTVFTADPHTEWDPIWLRIIFGCDETIDYTVDELGFNNTIKKEASAMGYKTAGEKPSLETASRVLYAMGHGNLWDHWPAPHDPTTSKRYPRPRIPPKVSPEIAGVVDSESYCKVLRQLARSIMEKWKSLRATKTALDRVLREEILKCGQDPTFLNNIWRQTATEMHKEFPLKDWDLDFDCSSMPQKPSSDFEWVKDNYESAGLWHNGVYLAPRLFFKKDNKNESDMKERLVARAACLAPLINLEEVSKLEKLYALFCERSDNHPTEDFAKDYEWCHVGRASRLLVGIFCGSVCAELKHEHDTIVEPYYSFPNIGLTIAMRNTHQDAGWPAGWDTDWHGIGMRRSGHKLWGSGEAHVTLVSQCLIYGFLANLGRAVMESARQKEIAFFQELTVDDENWIQKHIENEQDLEDTNAAGRPGNDPRTLANFTASQVWDPLVTKKAKDALDAVEALWTDADAFLGAFRDQLDHHHCWLPPFREQEALYTKNATSLTDEQAYRWDVYYDVIGTVTRRRLAELMMWRDIKTSIEKIRHHERIELFRFGPGYQLTVIIQGWFVFVLSELTRRGNFASSKPMRDRGVFCRASSLFESQLVYSDDERLAKGLCSLPHMLVDKSKGYEAMSEEEKDAIKAMHDMLGNQVAVSIFSMRKIARYLNRLMDASPHLFTDLVRDSVYTLGLLVALMDRLDTSLEYSKTMQLFECPEWKVHLWGDPIPDVWPTRWYQIIKEDSRYDYDRFETMAEYGKMLQNAQTKFAPAPDDYTAPLIFYGTLIDDMRFETDQDELPLKRCYRTYSWLDEEMQIQAARAAGETAPQRTHTKKEFMVQLRSLYHGILENLAYEPLLPEYLSEKIKKQSLSLFKATDFVELRSGLADLRELDPVSPLQEDFWPAKKPRREPKATREEREKKRAQQKAKKARSKQNRKDKARQEEERARGEDNDAKEKAKADRKAKAAVGSQAQQPAPQAEQAGPIAPRSTKHDALFEKMWKQRPIATPTRVVSPRTKAREQKKRDDEEKRKAQGEDTEMSDAPAVDEEAEQQKKIAAKVAAEAEARKTKLGNKHWATFDKLFAPGPNDTMNSTDLKHAMRAIGYTPDRPHGSTLKFERDGDICLWPEEAYITAGNVKVDNRKVALHDRHGTDPLLDNVLLKNLKKRFEERGISLEKIQEHYRRR